MGQKIEMVYGIFCLVLLIVCLGIVGTIETRYTENATVYEVKGDIVTVETQDGNLWDIQVKNPQDFVHYNKLVKVKVTFNNNGTEKNIYDDKVVKIKKIKGE